MKDLKRGQSAVEYALLIILVAAAITAMTVYITRSANARLKTSKDEIDRIGLNEVPDTGFVQP